MRGGEHYTSGCTGDQEEEEEEGSRRWEWRLGGVQSREPVVPWELWEKRSPCGGKAQVARSPPVALGIVAL